MNSEMSELKCPLCSKPLATDEYGKAISDLKQKLKENFDEQNRSQQEDFERQIAQLEQNHSKSLQTNQEMHEGQLKQLQLELEKSYKVQADVMQKNYDTILKQNEKQNEQSQNDEKNGIISNGQENGQDGNPT